MLTAHASTPAKDFIVQLRTYVIAMGLSTQVVDCVNNLCGADDLEDQHAAEVRKAEDDALSDGAKNMKREILKVVNRWLENQPNYDIIAKRCEAMIKEIEKVEV